MNESLTILELSCTFGYHKVVAVLCGDIKNNLAHINSWLGEEGAGGSGARCLSLAIRAAASAACHLWSKFIILCPVRLVPAKWQDAKPSG